MPATRKSQAAAALAILTGLNLFNYIDRNVLFAVQPMIQSEFGISDVTVALLTSAFFWCYMFTAPGIGFAADRWPRKWIMVAGALVWSAATLLTAVTYDFRTLLIRHVIVGIGEATFGTVAPGFLSDYYAEDHRGRVMSVLYFAIPVGSALGYIIGGLLGHRYGWRAPFYVSAIPGFVLAVLLAFIPEPPRGAADTVQETPDRASVFGLLRNRAFWTATLGLAMVTFALGGLQVWMPTFLSRVRGIALERSNLIFGLIVAITGITATLIGGWISDYRLRSDRGAHYRISALSLLFGAPAMLLAIIGTGSIMFPAIAAAAFLLLLNTGPLNAALVNSVGAHVRATAVAVNLFVIHLLGDAFSPAIIGVISTHSSLQTGFLAAIVAVLAGAAVLFYGARFAPPVNTGRPLQGAAQ
ncbi:MAG: spinster family MFS transporter [Terriglobales bacterium]